MNVDQNCYQVGCKIADSLKDQKGAEGFLRDLGIVLKVHGPYAFWLYFDSKKIASSEQVIEECRILLAGHFNQSGNFKNIIESVATDPSKLAYAKYLLDKTFAYASYHLKALNKNK